MKVPGQFRYDEREALQYRQERIELLLAEEIVSAEMEIQLRETLAALNREVETLKARQFTPPQRQAA